MQGDETDETDPDDRYLVLSPEKLSAKALRGLIEEFVSRDGTDYGEAEVSLVVKVDNVMAQLARGEVRIFFDPDTERTHMVRVD
jgi:uncharacterized protein YheU (UPF0270 family)